MSYRHSSYRKVKKTAERANGHWKPQDAQRVAHWVGLPIPPKPAWWGKPKSQRAVQL
jgi:hypothetical protein